MTVALEPQTAVAYLTALTARADAVAIAAADGTVLAGDRGLAADARDVLPQATGHAHGGGLHAAGDGTHLVAVRTHGPSLPSVVRVDLQAVLAALRS